jgi:hypothetical protein
MSSNRGRGKLPDLRPKCPLRCAGSLLSRRFSQETLDFRVQLAGDRQRFGVSIRNQKACHAVVGQMQAIGALIHKHRNRRLRAGIGNILDHLLHDEWIANTKADDPGCIAACFFAQNCVAIKLHEEQESRFA